MKRCETRPERLKAVFWGEAIRAKQLCGKRPHSRLRNTGLLRLKKLDMEFGSCMWGGDLIAVLKVRGEKFAKVAVTVAVLRPLHEVQESVGMSPLTISIVAIPATDAELPKVQKSRQKGNFYEKSLFREKCLAFDETLPCSLEVSII